MIYAEITASILIAANMVIWGSLSARVRRFFRRVPAAPFVEAHTGKHVASQPRTGLPRRKPIRNRQPWQTSQFPVYNEACQLDVQAAEAKQPAGAYLP